MSSFNPSEPSVGFLLYDAARLMRRDFDRRARSIGLTRAQFSVLAHLARNEGSNQAAIADFLELEPITLVRLLDRLEESGWIERRIDPNDRRARLIHLTDKAWPVLDTMQGLAGETREVMLAGIDAADRATFLALITRIRANLTAANAATRETDAPLTGTQHG